jgi:hypothetical protein
LQSLKKERPKISALDKYVVFSISMLVIFCIAEMVVSSITGQTHDTLTTVFYSCFGGEILSCALIKIFKLKEGNDEKQIGE